MGGLIPNDTGRFNVFMVQGAESGRLNRQEFMALNAQAHNLSEMRAQFAEGGISFGEQVMLNQQADRFEQMHVTYSQGDYRPTVKANNPTAARQLAQSGAIFDGIENGSLTTGESVKLMSEQSSIAEQRGAALSGGINPLERFALERRLDQAGSHIFALRHNWDRGNSPFPGCF